MPTVNMVALLMLIDTKTWNLNKREYTNVRMINKSKLGK